MKNVLEINRMCVLKIKNVRKMKNVLEDKQNVLKIKNVPKKNVLEIKKM